MPLPRTSLTTRVLAGLVAGLGLGILVAQAGSPALLRAAEAVEPLGTLFINAIRMTVIPLVVGSLVVGVASMPDARALARVGGRAVLLFVVMLALAGAFAAVVAPPLLAYLPVDPGAAAELRASAATAAEGAQAGVRQIPGFAEWLVSLVPANPVRAAADGAMLPLIIFTLAFGVAAGRLRGERRRAVVGAAEGVAEASLTLVRWILELAPIGVFALALPLAARMGLQAAGAVGGYIVVVSLACVAFMALVLYPAAVLFGRVPPGEFARAALPAQAVAFSARSSLASLPAMIEQGRDRLRLPAELTDFLLPLAASTFRAGAGIGVTGGVLFIARLYGVELTAVQLVTVVVTVVLTSFSIPGVPAGSVIVMVPVLLAAGLPPEGIGVLLAIDTIPDMFRTATNVTADMTVATMLARGRAGAATTAPAGLEPGSPAAGPLADAPGDPAHDPVG
ncbi:MAG TPA: dicarboxylate/amino acid:cation symporter [Gemmatimonadaceae bacterium]|nr:dicarboxylate/amino acid:cation symporter [Gemmatimonadaceae bacterium]